MKKTWPYRAVLMPMSRTRAARPANTSSSSRGRPNSLTSMAPATLNRSVMVEPISASSCLDSPVSRARGQPLHPAAAPPRGQDEHRDQGQRDDADQPGQVEHGDQDGDQG